MPNSYDAIVLGLGAMGSAALAHLAARGRRVLGLEQFSPAHALGSSHGGSRIIRQAYFEDPAYVPLVLRAYELWAALEHGTGRHLFLRTGGLMAGSKGSDVVEGALRSAREHGLKYERLTATEIRRRFPVTRPRDDEEGVYEPDAGVLFPEECVLAHLQAAVASGAAAHFGTPVTGWEATGTGVRVITPTGTVEAEQLVITAGPWLGTVARELGLPLQVERQVMLWWEPSASHEDFAPGRFPIWILGRQGEQPLYGFPTLPGQGLKAAFHHGGATVDPDTVDRAVTKDEVQTACRALASWLPDAVGRHLRSAVCLYTNTPDEHFIISPHPHHPNVVLAGGFSGHGFKFAPTVGEILADLALEGHTRHPIGLFSPARFAKV